MNRSAARTYHMLDVVDVVDETDSAKSFVLDPGRGAAEFGYKAGQFLTVRLRLGFDRYVRCYSLSSCPATDELLKITVKRVPGGSVSTFLNSMMKPGRIVESMTPAGEFVLVDDDERDLVALASGSGITPVISIIKEALATSTRSIRLFFANQSWNSVIFADELRGLEMQHPDRLEVTHHIYDEVGYLTSDVAAAFLGDGTDAAVYVCGSRHFTEAVDAALDACGIPGESVRRERFGLDVSLDTSMSLLGPEAAAERDAIADRSETQEVTFAIRGGSHTVPYEPGRSVLDTARQASLSPPFACGSGLCGACLAKVRVGSVEMPHGVSAITPEEIADGWVLTCQAIPVTRDVTVEYPE